MEPLLSPFSARHAPFQTKRRSEPRWREREEKERLNGPLDQNDSCEEGSENKQGFGERLAAIPQAITIISSIVIMFTVIQRR